MARKKSSSAVSGASTGRCKSKKLSTKPNNNCGGGGGGGISLGSNYNKFVNCDPFNSNFDSISLNSYDSSLYSLYSGSTGSKSCSFDSESIVTVADCWSDSSYVEPQSSGDSCGADLTVDNFEMVLDKTLDDAFNASKKSRRYQTRINSLNQIAGLVRSQYCYDQLIARISTLSDLLECSLKQKRSDEISAACSLLSLVLATIGDEASSMGQLVLPQLQTHLLDTKLGSEIRVKCARALSLIAFLTSCEYYQMDKIMQDLISIATANVANNKKSSLIPSNPWDNQDYAEEDEDEYPEEEQQQQEEQPKAGTSTSNQTQSSEPEFMLVHCLELWTFLVGCISDYLVSPLIGRHLKTVVQLLDSHSFPVRMISGETVALLMERFGTICEKREIDFVESFPAESVNLKHLIQKLRLLSTDGQKFRGKRDLRKQRSSFRDILRTVENYCGGQTSGGGECDFSAPCGSISVGTNSKSSTVIRFGSERIVLNSWTSQRYYAVFCQLFGPSLNLHLAQNNLIREIFNVKSLANVRKKASGENRDSDGSSDGSASKAKQVTKLERHLHNEANKKALKIGRNRQRRNRSDKQFQGDED